MGSTRSAGPRSRHHGAAIAVFAASALTVSLALAGCGPLSAAASGSRTPKTVTQAGAGATPVSATKSPSQPPLGAGKVGTLAQVPWSEIGAGWALAEYTTGSNQVAGPVTLYMLDPEGGMYQVYRWPAATGPGVLVAWSGDKRRALFQQMGTGQSTTTTVHQLTFATRQITTFTLPSYANVLGYTRPDGKNILVAQDGIVRYSLSGVFQARLSQSSSPFQTVVSSPDGLTEVVNGGTGVELVSNAGGMVRFVSVPGTDATKGGCMPERWWNATDVLVACTLTQAIGPNLWLVPVGGAAPTALTPPRSDGSDFGDIDAWQLPTGLYVQALPGCGSPFLVKQAADGSIQPVTVPGSSGGDVVVATTADSMLVQLPRECDPGSSLSWFNPATGAAQPVLTAQPNSDGVVAAVPYDPDGDQPS